MQDVGGARVITSHGNIPSARSNIESRFMGRILEIDDSFAGTKILYSSSGVTTIPNPRSDGYRAIHYIIEHRGMPIEIQLKTRHLSLASEWSHSNIYKNPLVHRAQQVANEYSRRVFEHAYSLDIGNPIRRPIMPPILRSLGVEEFSQIPF
jgi:ppGpp synthetase/RelA/SpoT-type nucleotidyltranferase